MFDYSQGSYRIADLYKTIEGEAFDNLGKTIVLVRMAFPHGLKYAHLLPERELPAKDMTQIEVIEAISACGSSLPVHFINDEPILCGIQSLLPLLGGRELYLNTGGFIPIPLETLAKFSSIYIWSRPGLRPITHLMDMATEIRAYWKPGDPIYTNHVDALDRVLTPDMRQKAFLVPHNIDPETIRATVDKAMGLRWRFAVHLASLLPDLDKHLQSNPESELIIHKQYRETLGMVPNETSPVNAGGNPKR